MSTETSIKSLVWELIKNEFIETFYDYKIRLFGNLNSPFNKKYIWNLNKKKTSLCI